MAIETFRISRNVARDFVVQIYLANGSTAANIFAGTETLATTVFVNNEDVAIASPTTTWEDATAGQIRIAFVESDSTDLIDASYQIVSTFTNGGYTGRLYPPARLRVDPSPGSIQTFTNGAVSQGNARERILTVYCLDEDIAAAAPTDFAALCPTWQVKAAGTDGVMDSATPWELTSASVDFEALGVAANDVIVLTKPRAAFPTPIGELYAIDSVSGSTAVLRRVGGYLNEGQPPGNASGLIGVEFRVPTFRPQIDIATEDANRLFGIDPSIPGKTPSEVYSLREFRQFTVLHVLVWAYTSGNKAAQGDYDIKLRLRVAEKNDLLARMVVKWGPYGDSAPPNRRNLRLSR